MNNTKKTQNITKSQNMTKKNRIVNNTTKNYATIKKYKDFIRKYPSSLPTTKFIKYMNTLFSNISTNDQFNGEKSINDFFNVSSELSEQFQTLGNTISIHDTIYNKPNFNLLNLIAYFLFNKTKHIFKSGKANMDELKYQVGKDYHRIDVQINGIPIPRSLFPEDTIDTSHYPKIVDNLNLYIMNIMLKQNIPIKMNTIIKIDALLTQYLFGFIIDLFITILIKQNLMVISGKNM